MTKEVSLGPTFDRHVRALRRADVGQVARLYLGAADRLQNMPRVNTLDELEIVSLLRTDREGRLQPQYTRSDEFTRLEDAQFYLNNAKPHARVAWLHSAMLGGAIAIFAATTAALTFGVAIPALITGALTLGIATTIARFIDNQYYPTATGSARRSIRTARRDLIARVDGAETIEATTERETGDVVTLNYRLEAYQRAFEDHPDRPASGGTSLLQQAQQIVDALPVAVAHMSAAGLAS